MGSRKTAPGPLSQENMLRRRRVSRREVVEKECDCWWWRTSRQCERMAEKAEGATEHGRCPGHICGGIVLK